MYESNKINRRDFLKYLGADIIGLVLLNPKLYGDQVTKDPALLKSFTEIYKKYSKSITKKEGYELNLDVNGDGREDKVKFTLENGSILYETEPIVGKKFRIDLNITGKPGTTSLMGIIEGDRAIVLKTQWAQDSEVPKYLDALIKGK